MSSLAVFRQKSIGGTFWKLWNFHWFFWLFDIQIWSFGRGGGLRDGTTMLHFRIWTTFQDLLQGHIVFWTILFQLSVGICPRICKSSLSFLDIQNRSKSAKKPDSTLWFLSFWSVKTSILVQETFKIMFSQKIVNVGRKR